jgi:Icc-related predicted phosphoesterase
MPACVRILAVADYIDPELTQAAASDRLVGVDLVVSCGDLAPEYLASLARACRAPLYYVRGNHDIRTDSDLCPGCLNLHGGVLSFGGSTFVGLEGSHWYNGGPLQYTESEMRVLVRRARVGLRRFGRLDVVVTHAPPRGVGDGPDLCHRGFQSFRRLIARLQPRYFLHGHIHRSFPAPADRTTLVETTRVVNCTGHYLFELDDVPPSA